MEEVGEISLSRHVMAFHVFRRYPRWAATTVYKRPWKDHRKRDNAVVQATDLCAACKLDRYQFTLDREELTRHQGAPGTCGRTPAARTYIV